MLEMLKTASQIWVLSMYQVYKSKHYQTISKNPKTGEVWRNLDLQFDGPLRFTNALRRHSNAGPALSLGCLLISNYRKNLNMVCFLLILYSLLQTTITISLDRLLDIVRIIWSISVTFKLIFYKVLSWI